MSIGAVSSQRAFTAQPSHNDYTIQRGDTLSGIAARHGVSLQSLLAANPQIHNPNVIYPGQTVTIPSGGHGGGTGNTGGAQGPSGVGGATPNTQQGRINEAMGFFESKGWTRAQAAGIVGNLQAESGVDPNRHQNGGGPGYGLAQWEGPRQADFKAWAGKDIHQSSFREQLEFIQHELTTTERGAGNALKGATTASDAARIFCTKYERPGIPHLDARIANANAIFSGSSPTKPAPGGTPPATGNPAPKPTPSTGGNYTVRSGDTMSAIASRHGVSLAALKAANPQIKNINLIYPGQTVHIPGGGASQGPSKPQGPTGTSGTQGSSGASGSKAADIAKQFLGRNASELKRSGALPMNSGVPSNICCANFVSAVLQKAGLLNVHTDLVSGSSKTGRGADGSIGQILKDRGWKVVDAAHAKPGDVAIVNNGHHVEMVYSNKGGDVTLIGSNNINKDGTQQVSYGKPYGGAWYLTPP